MKILSWNVNGIRAAQKKGLEAQILKLNPDIFCLQEVKAYPEQVLLDFPEYTAYWMNSEKAGYAGVATFTKKKPVQIIKGLGLNTHDNVGRIITLEFDDHFVTNIYSPNSQRGLLRLDYRIKQWEPDLRSFLTDLDKVKPVIFCGDLNVAHQERDLKNPKANRKNAGFTDEERAAFDTLLNCGFLDSFRVFEADGGHYSWWTYRNQARERNIGWRIDYVCVSDRLKPKLRSASIHPEIHGSDHCPVSIDLD